MGGLLPFLAFVGLLGLSHGQVCPPPEVLAPCKCVEWKPYIYCIENSTLDIKAVFDRASEFVGEDVVFKELQISGMANVEIEEGAIEHLKFEHIQIYGNPNLEWIHPDAFGATRNVTTRLALHGNKLRNDAPRERDIYELLNNFQNLREIFLYRNRLTSIPSNALQNLQFLDHMELSNNMIGRNIGSRAFGSGGQNLKTIELTYNDIPGSGLPEDAFEGISTSASVDLMYNGHSSLDQNSYQSLLNRAAEVKVGSLFCNIPVCYPVADYYCDERIAWICDQEDIYRPKISFRCKFPYHLWDVWRYCDLRNNTMRLQQTG